ncbi:MAG: MgtC/SapB family protein [Methylohalobius crimeensis]
MASPKVYFHCITRLAGDGCRGRLSFGYRQLFARGARWRYAATMESSDLSLEIYPLLFRNLAIALALGLLIGLERGWSKREVETGGRIAGIRTFSLISLLGALSFLLAQALDTWTVVLGFGGLALILSSAAFVEAQQTGNYSITTGVAAFVTFVLGALAMTPYMQLAATAAVIMAILLGLKPVLHGWVYRLAPEEMYAVFKLLLISVVILPILPDHTYDPWDAFNPYQIWWMVVLISAISFVGYFAVRLIGPRRGILLTGLFGGLASSTAVALNLSRLAKKNREGHKLLAAGVIIASTTMFPRVLVITGFLYSPLAKLLLWPLLITAGVGYVAAWWLVRGEAAQGAGPVLNLTNPFEFGTALRFGALLALILWLTKVLKAWLGSVGIYLTAAASGISDVDAITLTLAQMASGPDMLKTAALGILLAAVVNTLVKGMLATVIGGRAMGQYVLGVFVPQLLTGGSVLWMLG